MVVDGCFEGRVEVGRAYFYTRPTFVLKIEFRRGAINHKATACS